MLNRLFNRSGKVKTVAGLKSIRELCLRLLSEAGAANSAAIAAQVIRAYTELDAEARLVFFEFLASDLEVDRERLVVAANAYAADPSEDHLHALQGAAEPRRQELLRRINRAPRGVAAIVSMRRDLLKLLRANPHLQPVDTDFGHLLGSWFNPGFLNLQQVDWNAPAALLEKIVRHEAVHEIRGWNDLRRRLQPDRRCYAFVHPQLPGEPLIFVEIALVNAIPHSIRELIRADPDAERQGPFTVAVFYSISNCEPGLRGVSLGNFLIKRVAEQLHAEIPTVKRFCTLSPIPGFRGWLTKLDAKALPEAWPAQMRTRTAAALDYLRKRYGDDLEALAVAVRARSLTEDESTRLARCAAAFLAQETMTARGDPVARFHLANGARLERINVNADLSAKGMRESFGLMVNYVYDLAQVEPNHERFVRGEVVTSRQVAALS